MTTSPKHNRSYEKIQAALADKTPLNWVFAGDSITHGAFHLFGQRDYTEHFSERIRTELTRSLDAVSKTAVSGWRIESIRNLFDRVILAPAPQIVSINIGMNDAKLGAAHAPVFESLMREVLDRTNHQLNQPAMILHVPQPIFQDGTPRLETLPLLNDIIRKLADEYQAVLVDHDAAWRPYMYQFWLNDPIHPNFLGHRKMAHSLFEAIGIFDRQNSFTCQLDVPHRKP